MIIFFLYIWIARGVIKLVETWSVFFFNSNAKSKEIFLWVVKCHGFVLLEVENAKMSIWLGNPKGTRWWSKKKFELMNFKDFNNCVGWKQDKFRHEHSSLWIFFFPSLFVSLTKLARTTFFFLVATENVLMKVCRFWTFFFNFRPNIFSFAPHVTDHNQRKTYSSRNRHGTGTTFTSHNFFVFYF